MTSRQERIAELVKINQSRNDLPSGIPPSTPRMERFNSQIMKLHPSYRNRWCEPSEFGCGCLGCANAAGGLAAKGFNHSDYLAWQHTNSKEAK